MTSILTLILLIILSAILKAADTAYIVVSDNQVNEDAEQGNKKAIKLQRYQDHAYTYMTTIELLVTLFALINGAVVLDAFKSDVMRWLNSTSTFVEPIVIILLAFILLVFHMVFATLIPKRLGNKYAVQIAYGTIGFVTVLTKIFSPILIVLDTLANVIGRLFGLVPSDRERKMTEEDIRTIVEESSKTGNIEEDESEMIQNIFDFSDTTVEQIMTHRTEISALSIKSTKSEVISYIQNEQYTRFPVYQGNLDHIIGTLHVKDLLKYLDNSEEKFDLKSMLRPPYFIPESKKTSDLFKDMQREKNHIAIVLDEYGGTAGIVTIEDLIEEIVGNIFDEYDEDEEEIKQIDAHSFEVDGLMSISDVEDEIEAQLPIEDYDTLSGFILGQLGRLPEEDEHIQLEYHGFVFEVLEMEDNNIITRVKVTKIQDNEEEVE